MKARYMLENPEEIQATMKITMPVHKWEELRDKLNDRYPSWELSAAITRILCDARKVVYAPEVEVK